MSRLRSSQGGGTSRRRYTDDAFAGIEYLIEDDEDDTDNASFSGNTGDVPSTIDQSQSSYEAAKGQNGSNTAGTDAMLLGLIDNDSEQGSDDGGSAFDDDADVDASETNVEEHAADSSGDGENETDTGESLDFDGEVEGRARSQKPWRRVTRSRKSALSPNSKGSSRSRRKSEQEAVDPDDRIYFRGLPVGGAKAGLAKQSRILYFFGPESEDYALAARTRKKYSAEPCLPSRKANAAGAGGFICSAAWEELEQNADFNWKWFDEEGGEELFSTTQVFAKLRDDEIAAYLPYVHSGRRAFVMGAIDDKRFFNIEAGQCASISSAFTIPGQPEPAAHYKAGFVLNLGARIHCLEWVPSQPGSKQYLSMAVLVQDRHNNSPGINTTSNAFRTQDPHKTSLQIWEFASTASDHIDTQITPVRRMTIGLDFGDTKAIKWCHVPCNSNTRLGLVACITGDGMLRVLAIPRPSDGSSSDGFVLRKAAVEVKPPGTVFTSVTWISSSRLVAGCANGCLAIWDLPQVLDTAGRQPRPVAYFGLSTSYIISVTTCYPTLPHMLLTTSMQGFITLTDLRSSQLTSPTSTVYSQRSRHGQPLLAFNHLFNAALTIDDSYTALALPLRMLYTQYGLGRVRSHATCLATSPFHPFLLVGTASGDVVAMNPMMRILMGPKTDLWQQKWFTHEWRRASEAEKSATAAATAASSLASSPVRHANLIAPVDDRSRIPAMIGIDGLSNFSEGYAAEKTVLVGDPNDPTLKDGTMYTTLYEERSAITALAWNPNLHVAGWAAAGMADGLLRVEDIAS